MRCKFKFFWFALSCSLIGFSSPGLSDPYPKEHPACTAHPELSVMDSSTRVTKLFDAEKNSVLDILYENGVRTIFRYYDMPKESIRCKTLLPFETDAILAKKKFKIGVVFQNNSDDPNTFIVGTAATAKKHADRALELAAANGQPKDSAIYFGTDGADLHLRDAAITYAKRANQKYSQQEISAMKTRDDRKRAYWYNNFLDYRSTAFRVGEQITKESIYPFLDTYFGTIAKIFKEHAKDHPDQNYKIGVYCTYAVCDHMMEQKDPEQKDLVSFYWLTAEGRDESGYRPFMNNRPWHLLQQLETTCEKWNTPDDDTVNFNLNFRSNGDIGDWNTVGKRSPIARPIKCPKD
jgi:hypothetical protein